MFNPVLASENIKNGYVDYITTSFHMADAEYNRQFEDKLKTNGTVTKGPYLEISGAYVSSKSISELIREKRISPLFADLESAPEEKKELRIQRPLYLHQEKSFEKIHAGENVIVTTGTGSGKTECFLIPVINDLLEQIESGTLTDSIRAILIYPMNALANDQIKRMRKLLRDKPQIRFGLYNGNTAQRDKEGLQAYRDEHKNDEDLREPLPNEILSREAMHDRPPHILITNYSMMEYLLLRPKDDSLFREAQLRFVILDEAHIYRGATGIETSLLIRRMQARIPNDGKVQYILTSATLGGKEDDEQIIRFGENLCGVPFRTDCIIRSTEIKFDQKDTMDYPGQLWLDLDDPEKNIDEVLSQYDADFAHGKEVSERYAQLCLRSHLYSLLRNAATKPSTISELCDRISLEYPVRQNELTAFINICNQAEVQGTPLVKAKYHYFVRALEGAYATLGNVKQLFLNRTTKTEVNGRSYCVFELGVCSDCGHLAIVGKRDNDRIVPCAHRSDFDNGDFFLIKDKDTKEWLEDEELEDIEEGANDFVVCTECGSCNSDRGERQVMPCEHSHENWIKVRKLPRTDSGRVPCPVCGNGHYMRFFVGSDAATAVLATELYEQLPEKEIKRNITAAGQTQAPVRSLFGVKAAPKTKAISKSRQFLCFSDSRSEAAYFASYMNRSYAEFLRRRGIWHIADRYRKEQRYEISVKDFVTALSDYYEQYKSFLEWNNQEGSAQDVSRKNAWVAIMNEIYNARRDTGLISMGVFSISYKKNREAALALSQSEGFEKYSVEKLQALLDLLIMDAVYTGSIECKEEQLNEEQREYVFFTRAQQKLVEVKLPDMSRKAYLHGWCGRKRTNGNFYKNSKIQRIRQALKISEEEADHFLHDYWGFINEDGKAEFTLSVSDFVILLYPFEQKPFYRCCKCGRVTPFNMDLACSNVHCPGKLEPFDAYQHSETNHFARLYRSERMNPLYIKEHTAQLSKRQQAEYQNAFVSKTINALSCSTTFEMGVDVGSLETVYMRNVPPNPANYVQRAGRAGRAKDSAAFILVYSKLSSHDFTYFGHPEQMISGKISAPVFTIENEKIIRRHIYAIALSYFLKQYPEIYAGDDRSSFLLEGGYEKLIEMLQAQPDGLRDLLKRSLPVHLHDYFRLNSFGWLEQFIGEDGVLSTAYQEFHGIINEMEREINSCKRNHNLQEAAKIERQLRFYRASKEDGCGKRSLIDFWVRNNILPKYGFPVDTVELQIANTAFDADEQKLTLSRDLQMAIAEYAPGCQIVADDRLYESRYIRKLHGKNAWEYGAYAKCATCGQYNFSKILIGSDGRECISCHSKIPKGRWLDTLEPRMGFVTDGKANTVPMRKPDRAYKTDDYYVGDQTRHEIDRQVFSIRGRQLELVSTSNDSLVVVGDTQYYVCPACGYASETEFPTEHRDSRGTICRTTTHPKKVALSHDFKTDVVHIFFKDSNASDLSLMLSVMYALLEGLSSAMGIERNDIKGCLHLFSSEFGMIYTVILYDAVAGGAGHVRRMVTSDGAAFEKVVNAAVKLLDECNCSTSCYHCLRNFYNQKIHDLLDRKRALEFLKLWQGDPERLEEPASEPEQPASSPSSSPVRILPSDNVSNDYTSWTEASENLGLDLSHWDHIVPYSGSIFNEFSLDDNSYVATVCWENSKVIVLDEETGIATRQTLEANGWQVFSNHDDPHDIAAHLKEEE